MPYLRSDGPAPAPRDVVFAEGGYNSNEPRDLEPSTSKDSTYWYKSEAQQTEPLSVCRAVSARTEEWKLIYRSDPTAPDHDSELYDLVADPLELANLYGSDDARVRDAQNNLTMRVLNWLVQTSDVTPYSTCDRGTGECTGEPWR